MSDTEEDVQLDASNSGPWSIFTTILIAFGIGMLLTIGWILLRPRKTYFFAPKAAYDAPISIEGSRNHTRLGQIFNFCRRIPDEEIIKSYGGVDQLLFIRFLKYSTIFFCFVVLFGFAVLIPVNKAGGRNNLPLDDPNHSRGLNIITIANIEHNDNLLWAHLAFIYLFTGAAMVYLYFVVKSAADLLPLRVRPEPQAYSIMVANLEEPLQQSDQALLDYYVEKQGEDRLTGAIVSPMNLRLYRLQAKRDKVFRKWQSYAGRELEGGSRLKIRTGLWGLRGEKVDALNYYRDQIIDLDQQIITELKAERTGSALGFVSFDNMTHAMQAAHGWSGDEAQQSETSQRVANVPNAVRHPNKRNMKRLVVNTPFPAPDPEDVNWKAVGVKKWQRYTGNVLAYTSLFLLFVFFYPAIVVSAGLFNAGGVGDALNTGDRISNDRFSGGAARGLVSTIILVLFSALLPVFVRMCLSLRAYRLRSELDRDQMTAYWSFLFIEIFLGFTAAGTIFNRLEELFASPTNLVELLAITLTAQSTFYINWLSLRAFFMLPLGYTRLVDYGFFLIKSRLFFKSKVDRMYALAPPVFPYHLSYAIHSFNFLVGLTYSVIAPLVTPWILFYFAIAWAWERHQTCFVNAGGYEKSPITPRVHGLLAAGVVVFQLVTVGVLALKRFPFAALAAVPIVVFVVFALVLPQRFREQIMYVPLKDCEASEVDGRINRTKKPSDDTEQPLNNIEYYRDPNLSLPKSMDQFMDELRSGTLVIKPDKEISSTIAAKGGMSQAL